MSFEEIEDQQVIPNYSGICPRCREHLVFVHDLRCPICDNQRIVWCPGCQNHKRLRL